MLILSAFSLRNWTPARFLFAGGTALIALGAAGIAGLLGEISPASFFHPPRWIDWVHLAVGTTAIATALLGPRALKSALTLVPATVASAMGLGGLVLGPYLAHRFRTPELADPSDHIAHLIVGVLALWALWNARHTKTGARVATP
jgi:hypothetical protein